MASYGVDTWIYVALPIEDALKRIKEKDISYVELSYEHFSGLKDTRALRLKAKEVADRLSSLGLRATQMHAPFGEIELRLSSDKETTRKRALEELGAWIEACSIMDVTTLVVHTVRRKLTIDETFSKSVAKLERINIEVFRQLAKYASEWGVEIAVENRLEETFGATPRDLLLLVERTDPSYIGICLDTGHANIRGLNIADFIKAVGEHLIATHIHDNDGKGDQHLPPLMGNIRWSEFVEAIRLIGYRRPLIAEIAGYKDLIKCDNNLDLMRLAMEHLLRG